MLRVLTILGVLIVAVFALWPFAAWLAERAPGYHGAAPPSCGAFVLPSYIEAVASARLQLQAMMAEREISGMSVAVAVRRRLVWREGLGYADTEAGTRACPDTLFRAASVSKLFTAAAMGRLIDSGRLDPNAPIQRYVPSFPEKGAPITARLLASHRAGIRPYRNDLEAINHIEYGSVTESLAQFSNDPLVAVPRSRFVYSNYGYVLLSAVIEGASGQDFLSYVKRDVFGPLRMNSTIEDRAGAYLPQRATFYDNVTPYSLEGQRVLSPPNNFSGRWASGGFLSTADDLVRFGEAHMYDPGIAFLSTPALHLLMRPQTGIPPLAGYGLGWMTARDLHGRLVHFHFGAGSGATALLAIWPHQQVVLAVMGNLGHARLPFNRLASLVNPFLGGPKLDQIAAILVVFAAGMISTLCLRRARQRR